MKLSVKVAAIVRCNQTACRSNRWKPNSGASVRSIILVQQGFSCVNGFCPSFDRRRRQAEKASEGQSRTRDCARCASLPAPALPATTEPLNVLVTGIGGTGVITIGQIMAMAAHLEGKACSVLDITGLAQKGGAVMSHVRLADNAADLHSTRVGTGMADLVIGCDEVVTASRDAYRVWAKAVPVRCDQSISPTSTFIKNPDWLSPAKVRKPKSAIPAVKTASIWLTHARWQRH
jgi:indolepyruvate ferredoxin oxidoreductase